jgi:nicotinamide-nucleotide amidase
VSVEIITIGNELLSGSTVDTNAAFIASSVNTIGLSVSRMSSVGDNMDDMVAALKTVLPETRFVIVTGGLGPTDDDCTAVAAARAFGKQIVLNQEALAAIEKIFAGVNVKMPFPSKKQAMLPEGVRLIPNPVGTASGFLIEEGVQEFMFLPGVPREVEAMTESFIIPHLRKQSGSKEVIITRAFRVFGLWESAIQERLEGAIPEGTLVSLAYLPSYPEVRLKLTGKGADPSAVQKDLDQITGIIHEKVGQFVYSSDDEPLEAVVGQHLRDRRSTLALAESCTGGLISHRLTNVSGSSDYLERSVVVYSNRAKTELLNIPEDILKKHGAVSEPVALLMAKQIRELSGTTFGLSVTGIAGPTGGSPEKPVGTVFISVASELTEEVKQYRFYGSREQIKLMTSQMALSNLRLFILNAVATA